MYMSSFHTEYVFGGGCAGRRPLVTRQVPKHAGVSEKSMYVRVENVHRAITDHSGDVVGAEQAEPGDRAP